MTLSSSKLDFTESIFTTIEAGQKVLNEDPTAWLEGDRPPPLDLLALPLPKNEFCKLTNQQTQNLLFRHGQDWNFCSPHSAQLSGAEKKFSLYRSHLVQYWFDFLHSIWKWMRLLEWNNPKLSSTTLSHLRLFQPKNIF